MKSAYGAYGFGIAMITVYLYVVLSKRPIVYNPIC
jgi:hypothetical protein